VLWVGGYDVVVGLGAIVGETLVGRRGQKLGAFGLRRRQGGRDHRPALTAAFLIECTQ
jgi:hypothetical protein